MVFPRSSEFDVGDRHTDGEGRWDSVIKLYPRWSPVEGSWIQQKVGIEGACGGGGHWMRDGQCSQGMRVCVCVWEWSCGTWAEGGMAKWHWKLAVLLRGDGWKPHITQEKGRVSYYLVNALTQLRRYCIVWWDCQQSSIKSRGNTYTGKDCKAPNGLTQILFSEGVYSNILLPKIETGLLSVNTADVQGQPGLCCRKAVPHSPWGSAASRALTH